MEENAISVEDIITAEPPPALACVVGDFVTNLRASLDYIAWELAMVAGRPLDDKQRRRIAFPLVPTNHTDFAKSRGTVKHLREECGVPASTMSVIESFQPYHAGYESLSALDQLVRIDKHRTLLLCAGFVESTGEISIYWGGKPAWTFCGMTRLEMNLAAFSSPPGPAADYTVKVNEKPTIFVSLKDFPSLGQTTWVGILESFLHCVEHIISRFDGLFP